MKGLVLRGLLFFCSVAAVFGADYGLIFRHAPELTGTGADRDVSYEGALSPWVSVSLSEYADIYLSGSFAMKYHYEAWTPVPEITRFMLNWRPFPGFSVDAGRIQFSDFNMVLAAGLFDGAAGVLALGNTRLSLGVYYTGLVFKDTADIIMTGGDIEDYITDLDYHDLGGTYFASRRLLAAAAWEVPSLLGSPHGFFLQGFAQFDLNGRDERLNSQYLSFRFLFSPAPVLDLSLGGIGGLAQWTGSGASDGAEFSFALFADVSWIPPSPIGDIAALGFRWGSGRINETIGPLRPVNTLGQGNVLGTELSGVMIIKAAYTVQVLRSLSLNFDARYFLRSDDKTYTNRHLKSSGETALGAEFYAAMTWTPLADISVIFGGGAFFPGMGNAFNTDAPVQWKTALSLLFSF
jgi:hypothetical protein